MGKKIQPPWHLHADLRDCGTGRWHLLVSSDAAATLLVDEPTRAIQRAGVAVPLEPRPFDMLMIFLRRPLRVVTKTELRQLLWGDRAISDHVLTKCVSKLRFALERLPDTDAPLPAQAAHGAWLTAVYGQGYCMTVRATRLPPGAAQVRSASDSPDAEPAGSRHDPLWLLRQTPPGSAD